MIQVSEDILYTIFHLICDNKPINVGVGQDPIWTLRQVSPQWRTIIDYSPIFWNRWEVHYPVEVSELVLGIRTQLCIENSAILPLYISITKGPYPSTAICTKTFCYFLSLNIVHLSQRCVNLKIPAPVLQAATEDAEELKWPNLDVLLIYDGEITSRMMRGITNLQELELDWIYIQETEGFHLSQVKKLTFRSCRIFSPKNRIYNIIKSAPLQEELAWLYSDHTWRMDDFMYDEGTVLTVDKPFSFENLHTLRLHTESHAHEIYVLPMISVPHLKMLDLNVPEKVMIRQSLTELTERSNFKVKCLELTPAHLMNIKGFGQEFLSDVEELYLADCPVDPFQYRCSSLPPDDDDDLLYPLHAMRTYSIWFPSLQKLEMYEDGHSNFSILNFIKTRYTPTKWDENFYQQKLQLTPLKYLKYTSLSDTEDVRKVFKELNLLGIECGFEVATNIQNA